MLLDMSTSACFPAASTKYVRSVFIMKSKTYTMATPIARTQSVSVAVFGTTRS
jgi:hypothetical protein